MGTHSPFLETDALSSEAIIIAVGELLSTMLAKWCVL